MSYGGAYLKLQSVMLRSPNEPALARMGGTRSRSEAYSSILLGLVSAPGSARTGLIELSASRRVR